jgi:hypothetical protein
MYTNDFIGELISCPKTIIEPPKNIGINRGSDKTIFNLTSIDGDFKFSRFITVNSFFSRELFNWLGLYS